MLVTAPNLEPYDWTLVGDADAVCEVDYGWWC